MRLMFLSERGEKVNRMQGIQNLIGQGKRHQTFLHPHDKVDSYKGGKMSIQCDPHPIFDLSLSDPRTSFKAVLRWNIYETRFTPLPSPQLCREFATSTELPSLWQSSMRSQSHIPNPFHCLHYEGDRAYDPSLEA